MVSLGYGVIDSPLTFLVLLVCGVLLAFCAVLLVVAVVLSAFIAPLVLWLFGFLVEPMAASVLVRPLRGLPPHNEQLAALEARNGRLIVKVGGGTSRHAEIEELRVRIGRAGGGPIPIQLAVGKKRWTLLLDAADEEDKALAVSHRVASALGLSHFRREQDDGEGLALCFTNPFREGHPYRSGRERLEPIAEPGDTPKPREAWTFEPPEASKAGVLPKGWSFENGLLRIGVEMRFTRLKGLTLGILSALFAGAAVLVFVGVFSFAAKGLDFDRWLREALPNFGQVVVLAAFTTLCWLPRQLKGGWRLPAQLHRSVQVRDGRLWLDGKSMARSAIDTFLIVDRAGSVEAWALGQEHLPLFRLRAAETQRRGARDAVIELAKALGVPWVSY